MADANVDAFGFEALDDELRDVRILAHEEPRQHLDLSHVRTETCEALRKLAADGPPSEHDQPPR